MNLRKRLPAILGGLLVYGSLTCLFIVTFYPFWNILVLSLNDAGDSMRGGLMLWPRAFTLDSYLAVFRNEEIFSAGKLTLIRTLTGVPLAVANTSLLAYGLSRHTLPGRKAITFFFVFTMYFSGGLIPSYMVIKSLGLIDNFWVFILPNMVNIFWMLLVRTYMEDLPKEMEESARLDGANDLLIFARIILPLCIPVLATITLFSAVSHWNAWYDSYVYTYKPELTTLSSVLVRILNQYQTGDMLSSAAQLASQSKRVPVSTESIRMTVTMVSTLPIFLVYPLLQKYFLKGLLIGAIKS
jgi:putative aldouronate transport system permease protein